MPMSKRRLLMLLLCPWLSLPVHAERGKDILGTVTVTVVHASNEAATGAVAKFKKLDQKMSERLSKDEHLKFAHYTQLGVDDKPLYRSYENWAQPLSPSDEILVRFEAQARPSKEVTRLDVELWLSKKKVLKSGAALSAGAPLFVLGPEWRNGKLILIISLAPFKTPVFDTSP